LQLDPGTPDGYDFLLHMGPLGEANKRWFNGESTYLQEVVDHRIMTRSGNRVRCQKYEEREMRCAQRRRLV